MLDGRTLARFRDLKPGTELVLTHRYRQPSAKVFAALTTPERIEAWMGVTWLGDPAPLGVGSNFSYRFANSEMASEGRVVALEPGRLIEHTWFEKTPPGFRVAWRLEPDAEGCVLTLTQSSLSYEDAPRNGAGWTTLIDQLDAWLEGRAFRPGESWPSMRDRYAAVMGPRATRDGRRFEIDGRPVVQFARLVDLPPAELWAWLTERDKLARWLGDVDVEPRLGGAFRIRFAMEPYRMEGTILSIEPPRRLSMIWREDWFKNDDVVLDIGLEPREDGTLLTLTHTFPAGYDPGEYLLGWHEFLDILEGAIGGRAPPDWSSPERQQGWEKLKAIYAAVAGAGG